MLKLIIGAIGIKRLQGRVSIVPAAAGAGGGKMQEKTVTPSTAAQVVTPDGGYAGMYRVNVEAAKLQDKIVSPSTAGQTVQADDGSLGLGTVTVQGAPVQEKTITPSSVVQIAEPDAAFFGLSRVTVTAAPLQAKNVMPGTEAQTIEPDEGSYGLSVVEVAGDENLVPENIVEGVTIFGVTGENREVHDMLDEINGEESSGSIEEKLVYLYETKTIIEQAIESHLVEVPFGTPFRDYAALIGTIASSGGTGGDESGGGTGGGGSGGAAGDGLVDYNGHKLPDVSKFMDGTYKDAVIMIDNFCYYLYVIGGEWEIVQNGNETKIATNGIYKTYSDIKGPKTWSMGSFGIKGQSMSLLLRNALQTPIWATFDIPGFDAGGGESGGGITSNADAYLCNGNRVPKFPAWDKQKYPYAFISGLYVGGTVSNISLNLLFDYEYYISEYDTWCVKSIGGGKRYKSARPLDDAEWTFVKDITDADPIGVGARLIFWSNFDIKGVDGSRILAASVPRPVYE